MSITKTLGTTKRPWTREFRQFVAWSGEHPLLCAAVFFALAVAVRLLCSSLLGPIMISIRPDEYRYLHLARSTAEGGPFIVRGEPTNFQKILYPLLISPAFLLARDPVAQIKIVGVINVLLMSSVVFPVALLVRKLTPKTSVLLLTLAFAVALPDFMYTLTFLCEPLYWPLCIWVFYFFHRAMVEKRPRKRLLLFALFGFFTYLAYLTKEIAAAYLIAAAAVLIIEGVRDRRRLTQNGLALLVYACAFFAAFFILKLALFSGLGNSYDGSANDWDQIGLSALATPGAFGHMLYSAAALFLAAILSFHILPVTLPLFGFRTMGEEKRRMYLFSAFSLLITVGAIAYTVSIREPQGDQVPRWHLRLLAPIVIPFVILCFDFLLSQRRQKQKLGKMPVLILTATFCILLMILLPAIPTQDYPALDHASLTVSFPVLMLIDIGMDAAVANMIWMAWLLFMLMMTIAGIILLLKGKKRAILIILLCTISMVSLSDNFINHQAIRIFKQQKALDYYLDYVDMSKLESGNYVSCVMDIFFSGVILRDADQLANAAASVSCYIQQLDDVLYDGIISCMSIDGMNYIETYAPQNRFINNLLPENIRDYVEAGKRELVFDDLKGMDYIIVMEDYNPFANVEVVYEQAPFFVLHNLDPTRLCFLDSQA